MKTEAEIRAKLAALDGPSASYTEEFPTYTELLEWVLAPSPVVHEGAEKERCNHTHSGWFNREKVFADRWKETNNPPPYLNSGYGTLAWLLCSRPTKPNPVLNPFISGQEIYRHLTQEEATAAASAIQWLGTNCGWCWLEECIRACGFDLIQRREPKGGGQ